MKLMNKLSNLLIIKIIVNLKFVESYHNAKRKAYSLTIQKRKSEARSPIPKRYKSKGARRKVQGNRNRNRNRNLKTSKALLKSQAHQGTSLFTSAATNQRGRLQRGVKRSSGPNSRV